jgi:hypothetical protein
MDYPGEYNADLRTLTTEDLTSLNLQNLGTNKAADDAADLMFELRKQLKSLKLDVLRRFLPEIRYDNLSSEEFEAAAAGDYDMACSQDTLYPFIYRFALANEPEPMRLEALEIYGASDAFNADNWLRTFDFYTIQKLTITDGRFSFKTGAEKFWTYMRELKVSFKSLKTDCEVEELDLFLESLTVSSPCFCAISINGGRTSLSGIWQVILLHSRSSFIQTTYMDSLHWPMTR